MNAREQKLAKLQAAIEEYQSNGSELFDEQRELNKAPVRHRALLLLDQRARSRFELKERLKALEFDETVIDEVLDDLQAVNLVDDAAFAHEWVRQRHELRGKSRKVLNQELKQKGVAETIRNAALEQVDEHSERALARKLAAKKARSIKTAPENRAERDKHLRRILGVLARRGFAEAGAFQIALEALDQRIEELR
ncbi:recombination regulator RecX [Corynebacterium gerontici]|uniref:Regulatory protein RecX n=1 Tax=Corynebacterium gerontici TaxID=2079234 RepID=A0A3G6J0X7_9CORY|nr:recombination regulator RecX [Corynebacterium gerontici]AZA11612.1 Regulatory protein RecX [Corynebacterium gerontici]